MASLLKMDIKDLFKSKKTNNEGAGSEVNKILLTRLSLIIFIGEWGFYSIALIIFAIQMLVCFVFIKLVV